MAEFIKWLRTRQVCERRGCSRTKLHHDVKKGLFPPPAKRGARTAVWPETDLIAEERQLLAEREQRRPKAA